MSMRSSAKKRRGRPHERTAPHRPVLSAHVSARVREELYEDIKKSARAHGRSVSGEVMWLAELGLNEGKPIMSEDHSLDWMKVSDFLLRHAQLCDEHANTSIAPQQLVMAAYIFNTFGNAFRIGLGLQLKNYPPLLLYTVQSAQAPTTAIKSQKAIHR